MDPKLKSYDLHMCGYIKLDFSTATTHDIANATSKFITANKCDTAVIKVCWYLTKLRHYIKLICVIIPYLTAPNEDRDMTVSQTTR